MPGLLSFPDSPAGRRSSPLLPHVSVTAADSNTDMTFESHVDSRRQTISAATNPSCFLLTATSSTMSIISPCPMPPPRPRHASNVSPEADFNGRKRSLRPPKESHFQDKHGSRHHAFDQEKAPYPLSYDRHVLELESIDNRFVMHVSKSVSVIDFKGCPPKRSLDLGCGAGTWILEAAREWPECEFVGFDLVNVQIPIYLVDGLSDRVQWVHGNFLTTKLPFDDDEFDHVHLQSIGRGVPENKWGMIFEEVNRVLRPGGVIEVLEHDITFPTLPRWFTAPLHARNKRSQSVHYPEGSQRLAVPNLPPHSEERCLPHDHVLLESLYYSVFENCFINLRPTAILPMHFTSNFRRVISAPVVHFHMPPVPSLQPLPQSLPANSFLNGMLDSSDVKTQSSPEASRTRPNSQSFSSTESSPTSSLEYSSMESSSVTSYSTAQSLPAVFSGSASDSQATVSAVGARPDHSLANQSTTTILKDTDVACMEKHSFYTLDSSAAESTLLNGSSSHSLIPLDALDTLHERALAMQLYCSYQSVLACKEAMWEELMDRMLHKSEQLKALGWDDEDLEEFESRSRFERLVERYRSDMQARIAFWCSMLEFGWALPPRDPLSKAELIEEERLYQAIMEAREHAPQEDLQTHSRSIRVFVGYKDE